jgi:hypothetical protein
MFYIKILNNRQENGSSELKINLWVYLWLKQNLFCTQVILKIQSLISIKPSFTMITI